MGPVVTGTGFVVEVVVEDRPPPVVLVGSVVVGWLGCVDVVVLEVQDTGGGIPPDVQNRLFDPFFSTKQGGTGLGLSIAAQIVNNHHGKLEFQTQPGQGTTFAIILPAGQTQS